MPDNPLVYVVILNWNQCEITAACIESVLKQDYRPYRVLLVDNGSQDGSGEKLRAEFGDRIDVIVNPMNLGYSGGNNVGIRYALANGAHYVMPLNNDTIVPPNLIGRLVGVLQDKPSIAAVTPKILYHHAPNKIWATGGKIRWLLGDARSRGQGEVDRGQYDQPQAVDYAAGCCLMIPRSVFERVGLLDERYFAYYEDADWCLRACSLGLQIWYEPTATIRHIAGASTAQVGRAPHNGRNALSVYLTTRNGILFLRKHLRGWRRLVALLMYGLRRLLWPTLAYLFLGRMAKLRAIAGGAVDGFANHRPPPLRVQD